MLPKSARLSRKDFLQAKKTSQSLRTPLGNVAISPLFPNQLSGQISVVTSAKLHKHAVVRNTLRRLIYNSLQDKHLTKNIIVYPSKAILTISHAQLSSLSHQVLSAFTSS